MQLPSSSTIAGFGSALVVVGYGIYNAFFSKKKELVKEADDMDNKLITLLKETVNALEKRVAELEKKLTETLMNLTRLQAEKDTVTAEKATLTAVLNGRDAAGAEMMKQSMEAMSNIREMAPLVREIHSMLKK